MPISRVCVRSAPVVQADVDCAVGGGGWNDMAPDRRLHIGAVHKAYGRRAVLRGADLTVSAGMLAGVVGENGSGKSTLLRIAVGQLMPDCGSVQRFGALGYCPQQAVVNDTGTCPRVVDTSDSGPGRGRVGGIFYGDEGLLARVQGGRRRAVPVGPEPHLRGHRQRSRDQPRDAA
ncbi:ATP-binding cassette domain-containing protein [Streptomyces agglomeratus]|uniref:ATP-binding cassette domain-containing protein n=1 Tax=Streptomyces agglomeratus TaxID=285458 RepID=UPI0034E3ECDE